MDQASAPTRPLRVLLVDDDATILFALGDYLGSCGWSVAAATDRAEARERVAAGSPDLVVTDLRLGCDDLDGGLRLLAELAGRVDHVVLLTAFSSPDVVAEAERLGAAAVLPKRMPLGEVESLLRGLVEAERRPPEGGLPAGDAPAA